MLYRIRLSGLTSLKRGDMSKAMKEMEDISQACIWEGKYSRQKE